MELTEGFKVLSRTTDNNNAKTKNFIEIPYFFEFNGLNNQFFF